MSVDPRTPVDDLQRIARELSKINDRLRRLEAPTGTQSFQAVDNLQLSIDRLNAGSNALSAVAADSGSSLISDNQQVVAFTFSKPAWAASATALAVGVVSTSTTDQATAPLGATMRTVVDGVASTAVDVGTKATDVYSTKVAPLSRSFSPAGDVLVEVQITGTGGAAGNAWSAQLSALIFWYA